MSDSPDAETLTVKRAYKTGWTASDSSHAGYAIRAGTVSDSLKSLPLFDVNEVDEFAFLDAVRSRDEDAR